MTASDRSSSPSTRDQLLKHNAYLWKELNELTTHKNVDAPPIPRKSLPVFTCDESDYFEYLRRSGFQPESFTNYPSPTK